MTRDVSALNVPPSRAGARAARHRTGGGNARRQYQAYVLTEPNSAGRFRAAIDGESKTAYLSPTAKAVQVGDIVNVVKDQGRWVLAENLTWHEPPDAGPAPSTQTPRTAQTVTISSPSRYSLDNLPYPSGNSNNQLRAQQQRITGRVNSIIYQVEKLVEWAWDITPTVRTAINNNASRQNQARNLAISTRDSMVGLREGAIQDRIVSP